MKSYLQHLENNEAILLMYLGNELPDQDRVEVEEMLASDARLRAELENLRLTQQLAWDALGSLDAMTRPPMSPIAAQNRMSQLLREWSDRRRQPKIGVSVSPRKIPWWRGSFAAAASLMIGYYIWAVYHTAGMHRLSALPPPTYVLTDNDKLSLLRNSFEISDSEDSSLAEHVAEVASVAPEDSADSSPGSDLNSTGAQ